MWNTHEHCNEIEHAVFDLVQSTLLSTPDRSVHSGGVQVRPAAGPEVVDELMMLGRERVFDFFVEKRVPGPARSECSSVPAPESHPRVSTRVSAYAPPPLHKELTP